MNLRKIYLTLIASFLFIQLSTAQCGLVVADTVYVTSTGDFAGSLRQAINCVNDIANSITHIHFDIPGAGVNTISPSVANPLPAITKANVVIDARTQPAWYLGKVVIQGNGSTSSTHGLTIQGGNVSVYGLTITNYTIVGTGAAIFLIGSNALISQNAFIGNNYGINTDFPVSFTITDNYIGVDPVTNASDGNLIAGINLLSFTGTYEVSRNIIANNPIGFSGGSTSITVLLNDNSFYCNSPTAIDRLGFTVAGFSITSATTRTISGTGPSGALIEVFIEDDTGCVGTPPCQGKTLLDSVTVVGGNWILNLVDGLVLVGDQITATARVGGNNTSEFLSCVAAVCPTAMINFSNVQDACGNSDTGSATASVSIAGTYTYEWSDGQNMATAIDLSPDNYDVTATDASGCVVIGSTSISSLDAPMTNPTSNSPLCVGDTLMLDANASGGTPDYTYNWTGPDGFASSLPNPERIDIQLNQSGTYFVTVTDANGCTDDVGIAIEVNEGPTFNLVPQQISCNGFADGRIDLVPIIISPIESYLWSNSDVTQDIDNLGPGIYTVTVTDGNNCTGRANTTIIEPTLMVVNNLLTNSPSTAGGSDGSVSFDVNGGTAPYTYAWSGPVNGSSNLAAAGMAIINNLLAGDYNLLVTDNNGCTASQNFTITPFNCPLIISNNVVTDVSCAGAMDGSIDITIMGGGAPITYSWDNGEMTEDISGLEGGMYSLTVMDAAGCQVTFSSPIIEPTVLVLNNIQTMSPTMMGGNDGMVNFNLSGGTIPYAYTWTGPVNGSSNLALPGMATINNLIAGTYNLEIIDGNACMTSQNFTISPVSCPLTISDEVLTNESCVNEMDGSISLTVTDGTAPYAYSWTSGAMNDNGLGTIISNLSGGTYNITVTDQNNCTAQTTLVLNTNTIPDPNTTNLSSCDIGDGTAEFDLTTIETTVNPDPNLDVLWFEDALGTIPVANPSNYISSDGQVFVALSAGSCLSSLVSIQLTVLAATDPACMTSGCTSFSGTFSSEGVQNACDLFSAVDLYNNDAVLDGDDVLVFILHTLPGENIGEVLGMNPTPIAVFDPNAMTYGVTYYLTAVVGNDNGAGGVDLSDPCLSVATGQAVVFNEMLDGVLNFIQGEEVLCQGEDLFLSTNILSVSNYHWIVPSGDTIVTNNANLLIENIDPNDAGAYFVFVQEADCLFDETGPFNLIVLGLPVGEVINAGVDTIICDNQFRLEASPITSGSGNWNGPEGVNITQPNEASTLVTGLQDGVNQFIWTVSTIACGSIGSDTVTIVVASGLQAQDDFFTLQQANTEIFMDVLKNDGLADSTDYTLRAVTQPEFGWLETLVHGFQYFESEGRRGTVSFVYEVCYTGGECASSCATATVTIEVLNLPYLPEGFTPNGDGQNERLEVLGYSGGGDISMKLSITNRWGDIVYQAEDYLLETPWDGHLNNNSEPLAEGTYYAWMEITVDGKVYKETQTIYLIK